VTQALAGVSDTASKELSLWHSRLGHLNAEDLRKLAGMSIGIPETLPSELNPCFTCVEGKITRCFHRDSIVAISENPLALVHSDSCGPFRVPSVAGAKYFVLFIDDDSRMTWCYFLKEKNHVEVLGAFVEFKASA
jgi:hypothetical protein